MGDPVGPETETAELVWRLRELADRHGARAVFYEVGGRTLPRYLDLGYTLLNFGEEARVPLAGFSLDGSGRRDLRYTAAGSSATAAGSNSWVRTACRA